MWWCKQYHAWLCVTNPSHTCLNWSAGELGPGRVSADKVCKGFKADTTRIFKSSTYSAPGSAGKSPPRHAHWWSQGMCCSADLMPCLQMLLCRLQHPNIVPFLGACDDPPTLLLEFYQHGSISWVVQKAARQLQLQRQGHLQPDKAEVRLLCCAVDALGDTSIARRPCHCWVCALPECNCLRKCHLCTS